MFWNDFCIIHSFIVPWSIKQLFKMPKEIKEKTTWNVLFWMGSFEIQGIGVVYLFMNSTFLIKTKSA